jgi:hypothetical protein
MSLSLCRVAYRYVVKMHDVFPSLPVAVATATTCARCGASQRHARAALRVALSSPHCSVHQKLCMMPTYAPVCDSPGIGLVPGCASRGVANTEKFEFAALRT